MAKSKESEVITKASIEKESNAAVKTEEQKRKMLARKFKKQKLVPVQISPLYKPYFGNVMTVTINGISVAVPCNGKVYQIPASFAEEVQIRIYNQDQLLTKKNRLSDVSRNFESSPGELQLF